MPSTEEWFAALKPCPSCTGVGTGLFCDVCGERFVVPPDAKWDPFPVEVDAKDDVTMDTPDWGDNEPEEARHREIMPITEIQGLSLLDVDPDAVIKVLDQFTKKTKHNIMK